MMTHHQAITIPNTSSGSSLPYTYGSGNGDDYLNFAVPLYQAAITGDWDAAKMIFDEHTELVRLGLNKNHGTTLHAVATAKMTKLTIDFMKNLVNRMEKEDLELRNSDSNTAFWIASATGKPKMAKIMMEKNPGLIDIRGKDGHFPLTASAKAGSYDIVKLLYNYSDQKMDGKDWNDIDRDVTLLSCVENDMLDIALQMLDDYSKLASNHVSVLEILARKSHVFVNKRNLQDIGSIAEAFRYFQVELKAKAEEDRDAMKLLKFIWGHVMRTMKPGEIENKLKGTSSRILFIAAEKGNTEFIAELLRTCPDLMLNKNDDGLTIFHIAVMHRHRGIYSLLYEIGDDYKNDIFTCRDKKGNNMLHLVGKTTKGMETTMSGALLMQLELAWFREVKGMLPSYMSEAKNNDGQTPSELFSKQNEYLISKGMKLMKDCMLVATLMITVAFAAAFTIPGGYNQEHGLPIFVHRPSFIVFVITDAVSLIASTVSLIMFLTVLTSSGNQLALMDSLSGKVPLCILLLSVSAVTMIYTFIASLFVLYPNGLKWIPILIAIYAMQPFVLSIKLQYRLYLDWIRSLVGTRYMFQPKKRMLYTTKPRLPLG